MNGENTLFHRRHYFRTYCQEPIETDAYADEHINYHFLKIVLFEAASYSCLFYVKFIPFQ